MLGYMLAVGIKKLRHTRRQRVIPDLNAQILFLGRIHNLQSDLMTVLVKALDASRCGHDRTRLMAI
jgi:hypothetical protein